MNDCPFCNYTGGEKLNYENDFFYTIVPRQPAMYGHILIVSKKLGKEHAEDITDINLSDKQLKVMIIAAQRLSRLIKNELQDGKRRIKRVYVLTQCETPHFHFHLKPRYEDEYKGTYEVPGDAFLCLKELEEARWIIEKSNSNKKDKEGLERIEKIELGLCKHRKLISSKNWAKSSKERESFINRIKNDMNTLMEKHRSDLDIHKHVNS